MNPFLKALTLIMTLLLAVYIGGCDPDDEEVEETPTVSFVSAEPAAGDIDANSPITLTFDDVPEDIEVDAGGAEVGEIVIDGKTVTINGPFLPGALSLTVTWADGVETLNYTVAASTLIAPPSMVVSISPASVASPGPGEALVFNMDITGGEDIAGYQLTLHFDATALRYVSSSNADYLPAGAFVIPPLVTEDQVTLAATALIGGSQGDGTLATVTFEVVDVKLSALTLSEVKLTNIDADFVPVATENAEVIE